MNITREFTNMITFEPKDGLQLFLGKNAQGSEAAEILNELQLSKKLYHLDHDKKRKLANLYRLEFSSEHPGVIYDLREATTRGENTLTGPNQRPVTFVRLKEPVTTSKITRYEEDENENYYSNNSGLIFDGYRKQHRF